MTKSRVTKDFSNILRRVALISSVLKSAAVPVGLIQAKLMSDVVLSATAGNFSEVLRKSVVIILLVASLKLFEFLTQNAYQKAKSNAVHKCKLLLYKNYFSSPLSLLYRSSAGQAEVIFKSDFDTVTNCITEVAPQTVSAFVTVISYVIFLCVQSPLVGGILFAISFVQIVPPLVFNRLYGKYDVADKEIEARAADCILEFYNGFSAVKLFQLKKQMLLRIKSLHNKWWGVANRLQAVYRAEDAVNGMISNLLTYGTYAAVGVLILCGAVASDIGIQAIALSAGLYSSLKTCFAATTDFKLAKTAEKRISEFWNPPACDKMLISPDADIVFSDVSCALGDTRVFDGLNLTLPTKGTVVLRGENGSGKSTLLKLALGMAEAQSGEILTGGVAPSRLSYENFPNRIFFLPQEDMLCNLTVTELFRMMLDGNGEDVARAVGSRFGLDGGVYERNIPELSGGERKKVFLSLAFALSPDVLIMDEPTNSLDTESCRTLYSLLQKREKPTVIITHDKDLAALGTVTVRADSAHHLRKEGEFL